MRTPTFAPIPVPPEIQAALAAGAVLAVSISGGKDSQAMLHALAALHRAHPEWTGGILAVHADLGRAEWQGSEAHVRTIAAAAGVPLHIVQRKAGDMVQRWQARAAQVHGQVAAGGRWAPFWSSSANRYCTSDLKRDPINAFLRQFPAVVSAEGIRAAESTARARKPAWEVRARIATRARVALTWNPLLAWTDADVWAACGTSLDDLAARRAQYAAGQAGTAFQGWPAHRAYVMGNQRLSCALCVLAGRGDLVNGAVHNPALFASLLELEQATGATFQQGLALADLVPEVEARRAQLRARRALPVLG